MQFKLPELGEGVHEGELVKWRVKIGDAIKYDEPLCEIMTDKATVEIPSAFQGKVAELHVKEGKTVHVGELMLTFEGSVQQTGTSQTAFQAQVAPASTPSAVSKSNGISASPTFPSIEKGVGLTSASSSVLAAPSTRRLARELDVELSQIRGSGPHGRVMKEDVEQARAGGTVLHKSQQGALSAAVPLRGEKRVPFMGLRKKISEKMRLSKDKAAHFTYVEEADATALVLLRKQAKEIAEKKGIKITYLPFVMKAMVAALQQYPILNSALDEEKGELIYKYDYNIGLSIQTEDGLTAPVVKNVGQRSILDLARDIQNLVDRARTKRLTREDFEGGTITLTNAGSIGGLFATPIINYPEVAILGLNKIVRKPVVMTVNGREEITIRDWTYFSISLDHRVVDGAVGAEFMKLFIQYIENPSLLLLEGLN